MTILAGTLAALLYGYRYVQSSLTNLPIRTTLNFIGFTVADDPTNGCTSVTNDLTVATGVLPVASGGTGLTAPGTTGNVLTSNGTVWTSAAPSGGGGSPAGATNDVQINVAGAFGADSGNFFYDPVLQSLSVGDGCAVSGNQALSVGILSNGVGNYAFASGFEGYAAGEASLSCGIDAISTRYAEWSHRGGFSNFEDHHEIGLFATATAAVANLELGDATEFTLVNVRTYNITYYLTARGPSTAKRVRDTWELVVDFDGTTITINDATNSNPTGNLASAGYSVAFSDAGGGTLRCACNPGADTVDFAATVVWSETG